MSALPDTEAMAKLTEHLRYGCNLQQRDGERAANAIDALAAKRIADAARIAELEAENAKLREAQKWQDEQRARAFLRRFVVAPEDRAVAELCERHGYGAVMDAASRIWARKDGIGAFYVGGCIGFRNDEEARAALTRPSQKPECGHPFCGERCGE